MIQLVEGFWINPDLVTVVKSISKNKCSIWVHGQSAMDGFVLPYSAEEIVEAIIDARGGYGPIDEEDEEE